MMSISWAGEPVVRIRPKNPCFTSMGMRLEGMGVGQQNIVNITRVEGADWR